MLRTILFVQALLFSSLTLAAYPIIQGTTNGKEAWFSILVPIQDKVSVEVDAPFFQKWKFAVKVNQFEKTWPSQSEKLILVRATGLLQNFKYRLKVYNNNNLVDDRNFKPIDTSKSYPEVALVSCMADYKYVEAMWKQLETQKPDVSFFVGDAVYIDRVGQGQGVKVDPEMIWKRHSQNRRLLYYYYMKNLIPTFTVWDDHDFGINNGDTSFPHKQISLELYRWFLAQQPLSDNYEQGPGAASYLDLWGQSFYFLDGRYFREKRDNGQDSFYGADQQRWIFEKLDQQDQPFWLINGVQFFGKYTSSDSFEGAQPLAFAKFLTRVNQTPKPYSLMSGDIHFSEVIKVDAKEFGKTVVEVTSSSMHATMVPGQHLIRKNPRRITAESKFNFVILKLNRDSNSVGANATSWGEKGQIFNYQYSTN